MSNLLNGSQQPRRRLNDELVQMARCLAVSGPNINQIARDTLQHAESVRYRYRRFFLDNGITVQAVPNYPKLGFKRLVLIAKLSPACGTNARSLFNALSELCYLHSFTRVVLSGAYVIHVAVPTELAGRCAAVYGALEEAGLFTELEILSFEEMRNPPMKTGYFDFIRGRWSFDWTSARTKDTKLPLSAAQKVEKYDKVDLLILKELDIDAGRSLVKMAENVKLPLSTLEFHYRDHVQARGLVKGYRLVWQGTRYDREQGMAVSRKDLYIELTVLLKDGTQGEIAELMLLLNSTPFLWSEAYGPAYCAELFLPPQAYNGLLEFLREFANKVGGRLQIFVMDQSQALRFVISYPLFDGESKKWQLDEAAVMRTLGGLAPMSGGVDRPSSGELGR